MAPVATIPVVSDVGPDPKTDNEPTKSGKAIVGIIYPPPEIRNIVDKTASFVARNGPEFENRIRQHEANNSKFNFLNPEDPYHAYYLHKVRDFAEGKAVEPVAPTTTTTAAQKSMPQKVQEAIKAAAEFIPKDPPPPHEFSADPATLSAFDLDIIKLTAQFVARNGRQFLTQLMTREARNYQFDFLKPQHSNFAYFTKLVEQYTKIILPPKDIVEKLTKELNDPRVVYESVKYRVEWERHQRRLKEKEDAEAEHERLAYASIDWHDFVVVQTVDFQPHETLNLPPPCTPKDVGARILAQQRLEATKAAAQVAEMEVESGESDQEGDGETEETGTREDMDEEPAEETTASTQEPQRQQHRPRNPHEITQQPIPAAPNVDNVIVRKDYNPRSKQIEKAKSAADQQWVISPLTGERIPADKLADHLRFNSIDPQYFAQRQRELNDKIDDEPVYALGSDVSAAIKDFAARRTDIFGVGSMGAEQTVIGKKLGEEDKLRMEPKSIWDDHAANIEAASKGKTGASIDEQIAQINRAHGIPDDRQERERAHGGGSDADTVVSRPPVEAAPPRMPAVPPQPKEPPMPPRPAHPPAPIQQQAPRYHQIPPQNMLAQFGMRPMGAVVQMAPPPVMLVQQQMGMMQGGFGHHGQMSMGGPAPHFGGYGPPMGGQMQAPMGMPGMPPMMMEDDGPPAKRQKTEDQLVPETEWLAEHGSKGPISICLDIPAVSDKPEWKLNGQPLTLSFPLTEQISTIKSRIQDATMMPASKQKLVYEGIFIKDSNSLAFYNMTNGSTIQLQLKERGGRKK